MNENLLRAYIANSGMSLTDFSSKMGVSTSTLYRKIKGKSHITLNEANAMVKILKIRNIDIVKIFF